MENNKNNTKNSEKIKFDEKRIGRFTWKSGEITITDENGKELPKKTGIIAEDIDTDEKLQKLKWWELLTDEEIEVLSKEFSDYKKYDRPTLDMKTLLDFFFMKKYGGLKDE